MLIYAPMRKEDSDDLEGRLKSTVPARFNLERQKAFDGWSHELVDAFGSRFNGTFKFVQLLGAGRSFYTRKDGWLRVLELLARAGGESTEALHRALKALKDFEQDGLPADDAAAEHDERSPLVTRIDGTPKPDAKLTRKAADVINSALATRARSVATEDLVVPIAKTIDAKFAGDSEEAGLERENLLRALADRYGFDIVRRE